MSYFAKFKADAEWVRGTPFTRNKAYNSYKAIQELLKTFKSDKVEPTLRLLIENGIGYFVIQTGGAR